MLSREIDKLIAYGTETGILPECEQIYARNLLLDLFREDNYEPAEQAPVLTYTTEGIPDLEPILAALLEEACKRGIIEDSIGNRDLFDTKLMNCLMPRPATVQQTFLEKYRKSPEQATAYFYKLSQDSDYIRRYRVRKDIKWTAESPYGKLDITINLSKPEKDPKAIAAAGKQKSSTYPKCLLCQENEGYAGNLRHPARENHRVIPLTLDGQAWGMQYSPYVYYNEHCIVFNGKHVPMKIDRGTFARLFDFITQFPHYTLGSNADLPIVGGSILSHDHFQGGHYIFPMERAEWVTKFTVPGYEQVEAGIVKWPLSVIRLRGADQQAILNLADHILQTWRTYSDESAFVFAETDGVPHNTITPIARRRGAAYELDLVLRNNITTEEHPLGVFHPHQELHHIKKENIGLIEVMGLAVLPSRLQKEMQLVADAILTGTDFHQDPVIGKHAEWVDRFLPLYPKLDRETVLPAIKQEIGKVFARVLEDAGVYKYTEDGQQKFKKFIDRL